MKKPNPNPKLDPRLAALIRIEQLLASQRDDWSPSDVPEVWCTGEQDPNGAQAYAAYGRESRPVFSRVGGSIVWRGAPEFMLIGPPEKRWDLAFIARYPTADAFLEMVTDPDYRVAVKHRQAAVMDSRLVRMAETEGSGGFAG